MAQIFPFRAYRYSAKAGSPGDLLTQPYDKITPPMQERYYGLSPYNFVRLDKGKEEPSDNPSHDVYRRAADTLRAWIDESILEQDREPAFYPYFQKFSHPETNQAYIRKGFIGLTKVVDYDARVVHRHELTHSGPKWDRLELTRCTKAHFGQLFMLYDDPRSSVEPLLDDVAAAPPLLSVEDEFGVEHCLWKISEPRVISEIQGIMESKKLLIADGHHRYETALAYYHENPEVAGADKVMMTFVNLHAPGLVVLATHRVLSGLSDFDSSSFLARAGELFTIETLGSAGELQRCLDAVPPTVPALGAVLHGSDRSYLLTGKQESLAPVLEGLSSLERGLDVVILHRTLLSKTLRISEEDIRELKSIRYVRGFEAAVDEVRSGEAQVAFLLRPVQPQQVAQVAFSGGVMPQKSTDFYPKLLSGLTVYRLG